MKGQRNRIIVKCNITGIVINSVLSVVKIIIGLTIRSNAVVLDAVNGFSDTFSSVISIVLTALSGRKSNSKHPFGYGRLEYISSLLVTIVIIILGIRGIVISIEEILHPDGAPDYTMAIMIVMAVSLIIKLLYGGLLRKQGKKLNSSILTIIGNESISDAFISIGILLAIVIYHVTSFDIEPYVSVLISLLFLWTGVVLIMDTMNHILGTAMDEEERKRVKTLILSEQEVENVFNLVIHDYGENQKVGSADIVVRKDMTAGEIAQLSTRLKGKLQQHGLELTSIGIYGTVEGEAEEKVWDRILEMAIGNDNILGVYGFSLDPEAHIMRLSVLPRLSKGTEPEAALQQLQGEIEEAWPGYHAVIELIHFL